MSHLSTLSHQTSTPLIICGPTGVGKSAFAAELASRFGGEIVGADAFQVYAGLEILTAQPGHDALSRISHHLIGFLPPSESFDAARFASLAKAKISEISGRGCRPIITGGSGLYLKALTHGLPDLPASDPALRTELAALTLEQLQQRLDRVDPEARHHLDFQNPRRVSRALEIFLLTGRSPAGQRAEWKRNPPSGFRGLLLTRARVELDARIADNVRAMFRRGVVEEVSALTDPKSKIPLGPTASRAIGLREIQALLRGEISEAECIDTIILATRRYAKRQLTWFRNQFTFKSIDLTGLQNTNEFVFDPALCEPGPA